MSWNVFYSLCNFLATRHAPRERVSWNLKVIWKWFCCQVTLHVSVWVEIFAPPPKFVPDIVTLHVSVWVEIYYNFVRVINIWSRSTWACELKCFNIKCKRSVVSGHAPRERVSWNENCLINIKPARVSRSTWACELKLKSSCLAHAVIQSRSTWACELKCKIISTGVDFNGVTLHVSVWVEIFYIPEIRKTGLSHAPRERVSWNKFSKKCTFT